MKRNLTFIPALLIVFAMLFLLCACERGNGGTSDPFSENPIEGLDFSALCDKLSPAKLLTDNASVAVSSSFEGSDIAVLRLTIAKKDGAYVGNGTKNTSCERIFSGDSVYMSFGSGTLYTLLTYGETYEESFMKAFRDTVLLTSIAVTDETVLYTNKLDDGTGEAYIYFTADDKWEEYLSPADKGSLKAGTAMKAYIELDSEMRVVSITYSSRTDSGALTKLMEQSFVYGDSYEFPETKFDWRNAEKVTVSVVSTAVENAPVQDFAVPVGSLVNCDPFSASVADWYIFTSVHNLIPFKWDSVRDKVTEDITLYINTNCK